MKILIKGYYGFGNLGDDLLALFFTRIIKKYFPNDEIFIFSNATKNNSDFKQKENYNQYLGTLLDIPSKNIIDWTYKGYFNLVIHGGGGTFFDYSKASNRKKIVNILVSLFNPKSVFQFEKIIRKLIHKKSNITAKRTYAIGNNIGPFDTNSNNFIQLYSKIGAIDDFLVRDNDSEYYLKKFNYKGTYKKIHDVVFSHSYFPEIKEKTHNKEIKTIGIVLMNWKNEGEKYLNKFDGLTEKLKTKNIDVRYFAFSELDDEVLTKYTKHNINIWKPNNKRLVSYLNDFSTIDVVISMRFHGLVIANCMGIPSIGVGINEKIIDFINQTPQANGLVNNNFKVQSLINEIEKIKIDYTSHIRNAKLYNRIFQNSEQTIDIFIKELGDK